MTDNELLLAISDLLDQKLDSRLVPMDNKIDNLEMTLNGRMDSLETTLNDNVLPRLQSIEGKVENIEGRVENIEGRVENIEGRVENIEGKVENIEGRVVNIEGNIENIEGRVKSMELTLENDISPRLQTIESCYTSTYNRYKNIVDNYESMQEDMELVKKVVAEHSQKLQRLA